MVVSMASVYDIMAHCATLSTPIWVGYLIVGRGMQTMPGVYPPAPAPTHTPGDTAQPPAHPHPTNHRTTPHVHTALAHHPRNTYSPTVGTPSRPHTPDATVHPPPRNRWSGDPQGRRHDYDVSAGPAHTTTQTTTTHHHDHLTHRHHTLAPQLRRSQALRPSIRPRVLPDMPHPPHLGPRPTPILTRGRPHHPLQPRRHRRTRQHPNSLPPLQPAQRQRPPTPTTHTPTQTAPPQGFHRPRSVVE